MAKSANVSSEKLSKSESGSKRKTESGSKKPNGFKRKFARKKLCGRNRKLVPRS